MPVASLLAPIQPLTELWNYRFLISQLVLRDLRVRYKQAVMGFAWALLMPILIVLSGAVIRFAMSRVAGTTPDADGIATVVVKSIPWAFFAGAIGFANTSLVSNASLLGKVYFPREVFPLSAVLAQTVDSAVGGLIAVAVLPFIGVSLTVQALWTPLLLLILWTFTLALALFLSSATVFFRDVKYIVQVVLTFGIFFTPVFFEPGMLGPVGGRLVMLNPLSPILEGLRLCLVEGHSLARPLAAPDGFAIWTPGYLGYAAAASILSLVGATQMFHRLEFIYAERI